MKYLLDANALISLGFLGHEFHRRMSTWVATLDPELATCAIAELGFVRVLAAAPAYGITIAQARQILEQLKKARRFEFLVDDHDISRLPRWVEDRPADHGRPPGRVGSSPWLHAGHAG
jgi:predicted nucleic acid-binding protein